MLGVPLLRRFAYGFLMREGLRTDELARLTGPIPISSTIGWTST